MDTNTEVFELAQAATADRARVGGKAGVLGELAAAGFPVPPGLVVTAGALNHDGWEDPWRRRRSLGAPPGWRYGPRLRRRICRMPPTPASTKPA